MSKLFLFKRSILRGKTQNPPLFTSFSCIRVKLLRFSNERIMLQLKRQFFRQNKHALYGMFVDGISD